MKTEGMEFILPAAGGTPLAEEFGHHRGFVEDGPVSFGDAMGAVGIGHEFELPVVLDQLVEQHFFALIVDVVIAGAVEDQQVALQVFRIGERVTFEVSVAVPG